MKAAATVLTIIGMVVTAITLPYNVGWGVLLLILDIVVGILSLVTLGTNHKSVFIGIMNLLFCGLLGGIFYLCWNPESN